MVLTGPGIRLDISGPQPVAPPYSLLKTVEVIRSSDGVRWLNGVTLDGYVTDTPSLWEPCSEGTYRDKGVGEGGLMPQFDPFVVYIAATCAPFGGQDLREMASAVLEATESMGVEQGLAAGIVGSINPYFSDANLTILGATSVSPPVAIAYLENAIGSTGRMGVIHATPAVVANSGEAIEIIDGLLYTKNGTPVVSGDGYINIVPDGESEPGGGMDYIYATGPVEVRLGPLVVTDLAESLDRSDNTLTIRAERYVLPTWDTALQVGVLCDWKLCCGETAPV